MYELIIIISLSAIFAILLRKWPKTKFPMPAVKPPSPAKLSDINFFNKAEELFRNKGYKEAERYYLKAASYDPDNPLIYGRLGVIYTRLNNLKDAKEALKMAVRLDPDNGYYQNNLGLVLYNLGRCKEALIYFENAINIDDQIGKRWINLGLCREKIGSLKEAKEAYKRALELDPESERCRELLEPVEEGLKKK